MKISITFLRLLISVVLVLCAVYYCLFPFARTVVDLQDPALRENKIPRFSWRIFEHLSPKFETWAHKRVESKRAQELSVDNLSGTEWPLFGAVFYLWAVEDLQKAWEEDNTTFYMAPKEYAKGAINASVELVTDPNHGAWVKKHWGNNYLHNENVAYRMFLIAAITSHSKLTGSKQYFDLLEDQVESLSNELDKSAHGLLDDFPDQCYPGDVLTAIAMIKRADSVLLTDHSKFIKRALRGFSGKLVDSRGLPPYSTDSRKGIATGISRGCNNSYIVLFGPEVWPETAKNWYKSYEKYFLHKRIMALGFREFPNDTDSPDWYMDIDAGPVIAGHGCSASAFGIGAARINGRFDHAYPMSAELITFSWPLMNGRLGGPWLLSDQVDAPYLGEAAILYIMTRRTAEGFDEVTGGSIPGLVYIVLLVQVLISFLFGLYFWFSLKKFLGVLKGDLREVLEK